MQEKFTNLRDAQARVQQLIGDENLTIDALYLIEDCREHLFYVEGDLGDGAICGMIRPFEKLHWSLN